MSRTRRRVSRGLIALLIVVVVLGGVFYFHNTSKTAAREQQAKATAAAIHVLSASPRVEASGPTTAPVASLTAPSPATPPPQSGKPKNDVFVSSTPGLTGSGSAPGNSSGATALGNPAPTSSAPPSTAPSSPTMPSASPGSGSPPSNSSFDRAPSSLLADGLAKKDAGDLLTARRMLNDALQSGQLSGNDTTRCKTAMAEMNQVLVFSPKRFADDPYGGTYSVQSGDLLKKIAESHDITWELLCRLNNLSDPKKLRAGQTIKVARGPFHAVVSKRSFTMDLYLGGAPGEKGSMYVMTYNVGLGRDDSTPTGVWMVEPHKKIKNPTYFSPRGEGVIDADDPKNPLGERWIGLTGIDGHAVGKASYGVHGTIEPDSIGKMASMGCIRMRNEDVERVFELLVEGKSTVKVTD